MTNATHVHTDAVLITDNHRILLTVMYSIIAAFGVPANLMILITIIWNKKLRRLALNHYIVTLAFTDLLTCGLAAPFYIFSLNVIPNSDVLQNGVLCKGFLTVTYSTGMLTVSALAALSIDRYLAIVKPYLYCKYMTRKMVVIFNLCLVTQAVVTVLPCAFVKGYFMNSNIQGLVCILVPENVHLVYSVYVIVVNVAVPLLATTLCNIVVFCVAKQQNKRIKARNLKNKASYDPSVTLCSRTAVYPATSSLASVQINNIRKVFPIDIQENKKGNNENNNEDNNLHQEYDVKRSSKSQSSMGKPLQLSLKKRKSKDKAKDLKSSLSRFKFQYRMYISTLSMIILLFIFWSPFPVVRVVEMLGYNEQVTNYGYLYSTLGVTILCAINPIVIFITRKEFRKCTFFKRKKTGEPA